MKLRSAIVVLLASLAAVACDRDDALWSGPVTTSKAEARRSLEEGLRAFDLQKMTTARSAFAAAVAADPGFGLARAFLAVSMNSTGDVNGEMKKAVEQGASATPEERLAIEMCRAWSVRDRAAARKAAAELVESLPRDRLARFLLGLLLLDERKQAEAAQALEAALAIDRGFAPAHVVLARARSAEGKHAEARSAAQEAVRLLPGEALGHAALGDVHKQAGDCDRAIASYTRALELDKGFVPAYGGRARCHRIREDFAASRRDYEAAFAKTAALPDGAYKELFLDWAKAEDLSFEVAMTNLFEGDFAKAASAARETIEFCNRVRPQNAIFYYDALGRIYLEDGKLEAALATYRDGHESVLRTKPTYPDDQLWLGRYVHAQGRIHARARRFREALAKAAELEAMIDRAGSEGEPYRMSHHYLMGYIRLEQKAYAQALVELKQADQDDVFIQWLLARAHRGLGSEAEAAALIDSIRAQRGGGFRYALVRRDVLRWGRP